tara:strand:- start:102 stop:293 length:192 start_codon:yes stop_codon:yes gene_type:complete
MKGYEEHLVTDGFTKLRQLVNNEGDADDILLLAETLLAVIAENALYTSEEEGRFLLDILINGG